jgi:hypothetical protein
VNLALNVLSRAGFALSAATSPLGKVIQSEVIALEPTVSQALNGAGSAAGALGWRNRDATRGVVIDSGVYRSGPEIRPGAAWPRARSLAAGPGRWTRAHVGSALRGIGLPSKTLKQEIGRDDCEGRGRRRFHRPGGTFDHGLRVQVLKVALGATFAVSTSVATGVVSGRVAYPGSSQTPR